MQYPKNVTLTQETYDNATHSIWLLDNLIKEGYYIYDKEYITMCLAFIDRVKEYNTDEKVVNGINIITNFINGNYTFAESILTACNKALADISADYNPVASAVFHTLKGIIYSFEGRNNFLGIPTYDAAKHTANNCIYAISQVNISLDQCNIIRKILGDKITFPVKTVIKPEPTKVPVKIEN